MVNDLQLKIGPYRTTFVGTEITRNSTKDEWINYGEILKRVDEAKQWAIGDWLCDGKNHYGDGLYQEAERILGLSQVMLRQYKSLSDRFNLYDRSYNLTWGHHWEVASIKRIKETSKGKLKLSDDADQDKIRKFLQKAEKENWSIRELRQIVKDYKLSQEKEIELANEPEKFKIIYADPPWKYNDELIDGYGAVKHHYPQMSISELCNLRIKNISTENSVLFLWVTSPLLEECFEVINAWGFKYKTSFVWNKKKHNYGHYNSIRHEFLLVCVKGSCLPQNDKLFHSIFEIERTERHSEKPEEIREMIDSLYPEGKRIELFARGKIPDHWKAWGNELLQ